MWARQRPRDALRLRIWPRKTFLMQPSGRPGETSFVRAAANQSLWPPGVEARIGRSVRENLHPIALAAVMEICGRRTQKPLREHVEAEGDWNRKGSGHLAEWLLACASTAAGFPTEQQTSYLFTSGAHRARAIGAMLNAIGKTAVAHMVDVGTGVGLIPWLLCSANAGFGSAELFEPDRKRQPALDRLWAFSRAHQTYAIAPLRAEDVPFSTPADLIMFCQCLFRIDSGERRHVLARAWQALRPGGILLVNEQPKEAGAPRSGGQVLVARNEIVSLLPGTSKLFVARTGWRTAHDPHTIAPRVIGSSGLFVTIRPD